MRYNRNNISRVNENIDTKVGLILIFTCIIMFLKKSAEKKNLNHTLAWS